MKKVIHKFCIFIFSTILPIQSHTQPANDDCESAFFISSIDNYCSEEMQFTNIGATIDDGLENEGIAQGCFHQHLNGVWFSFRPSEPDINVSLLTGEEQGTIFGIGMSIFEGGCGSNQAFVECTPGSNLDTEWIVTDLTIGQLYYLLVESDQETGSFTLCINDFIAPQSPEADCSDAVVLCSKDAFGVPNLSDVGNLNDEMRGPCVNEQFGQQFEEASVWYVWTCDNPGSLTFTITPTNDENPVEDIDFILYELPGGLNDCENRIALRCMLSGREGNDLSSPCHGPTGLREGENDTEELAGCDPGDNNFLAPLNMQSNISYGLIINNFSDSGFGFDLEFGGTGTFLGPEPSFEPMISGNFLECEKEVTYFDQSQSLTDPIINWTWNFGVGADPQIASGNPIDGHEVIYESFGPKTIALTVESERGCQVTEILDVFVEPCCKDTSTLDLELEQTDIICAGDLTGAIQAIPLGGAPEFQYSLDGGEFTPNPNFRDLGPGTYEVVIQDIKGCDTFRIITIEEPDPIGVNAGPNLEIELGFQDTLNATAMPSDVDFTYAWDPEEGLDCIDSEFIDCPDPVVIAPGNTTYTVTITDEAGCTATDQVTVSTIIVRPFYAPNVIALDERDPFDNFKLAFGRQAVQVNKFIIYDRWGAPVFEGSDIQLDDRNEMLSGWDGRFGGNSSGATKFVQIGVYVWYAEVLFIDGVVVSYAGDVSVIK